MFESVEQLYTQLVATGPLQYPHAPWGHKPVHAGWEDNMYPCRGSPRAVSSAQSRHVSVSEYDVSLSQLHPCEAGQVSVHVSTQSILCSNCHLCAIALECYTQDIVNRVRPSVTIVTNPERGFLNHQKAHFHRQVLCF